MILGPKHDPQWQRGPWMSSWSQAVAQTSHVNKASSCSTDYRGQQGLLWVQGSQTSARSPGAALIINISMVSYDSVDHGCQHGLWQWYGLWKSWSGIPPEVVMMSVLHAAAGGHDDVCGPCCFHTGHRRINHIPERDLQTLWSAATSPPR